MRLTIASVILSFLVLQCIHDNSSTAPVTEPAPVLNATTGSIKGQIEVEGADEDDQFPLITIRGSNVFLIPDSNGVFEIQFLNAGSYEVTINPFFGTNDTTILVEVVAGLQTDMGTITLSAGIQGNLVSEVSYSVYFKFDPEDSWYDNSFSYYTSDPETTFVNTDSVYFRISAQNNSLEAYETVFTLKIDGVEIFTRSTLKLSSYFTLPLIDGLHLYEISSGEERLRSHVFYKATGIGARVTFEVSNGDPDTYTSGSPDLDLMLVNALGDTCYFRNANPDWGVPGDKTDDPFHKGDVPSLSSNTEELFFQNIPDGVYTIFVQNFFNSTAYNAGSRMAEPWITITVNDSIHHIIKYPGTLNEGQLLQVGTFSAPAFTFQAINVVTDVQTVVLNEDQIQNVSSSASLNIYSRTDTVSSYERVSAYYSSRPDTVFISQDIIYFQILVSTPDPKTYDVEFSLKVDGALAYAGTTIKLLAYFALPAMPGAHEYKFYINGRMTNEIVYVKPMILGRNTEIVLTDMLSSTGTKADLDLLLVNALGDTCNYKNLSPDWGVLGDPIDNPAHSGDARSSSFNNTESILFNFIPDGAYTVIVHNFYHPTISLDGPLIAAPRLSTTRGDTVVIDTLAGTLPASQYWTAGVIRVPEMVYQKAVVVSP